MRTMITMAALALGSLALPARGDDSSARTLLLEVAAAYQDATALIDEVEVELKASRGVYSDQGGITLGPDGAAQVSMDGYVITWLDGQLYMHHETSPAKYFAPPSADGLLDTYRRAMGRELPSPQSRLRFGKSLADYQDAFGLGRATGMQVTGHTRVSRDGRMVDQLQFTSSRGASVRAFIDPDTKLILGIELLDGTTVLNARMSPRCVERLEEPITYDTSQRHEVPTFQQLLRLGPGDPAPDFALETLDGRRVRLGDHRGSVVILDFWATWCGPCKWTLPRLQEFERWASGQDLAVAVLPVDMGERQRTREAKKEKVAAYWQSQGFTMPTLMDYDSKVARAYNVGGIPYMVIVGPDGTVLEVKTGFNPNLVEHLQQLTREALAGG